MTWASVVACCSTSAVRRAMAARDMAAISTSPSLMTPLAILRSRPIRCSRLDFPEPLGPTKPSIVPGAASMVTPSTIIVPAVAQRTSLVAMVIAVASPCGE